MNKDVARGKAAVSRSAAPAAVREAAGGADTWVQRVGGLVLIPGILRSLGVDPDRVLTRVGLSADALADPDRRIPFVKAVALITESVRMSDCAHFGLLVGQSWRLSHLGLIGELIRQGPTIGEALRTHVVNQRLFSQGIASYLFEYPTTAQFGVTIFHPNAEVAGALYDMTTATTVSCIAEMSGRGWIPTEVQLPRMRPADDRPYREFFRCEVKFEADRAAVRFPRQFLASPTVGADPGTRDALERETSRTIDQHLLPQLYRSLRLLMLEGDASLPSLARQFDMHHRTLDRRLRLQGTTFKQILDEVRFEAARELLRNTRRSVGDISSTLGYSEDSAFVRAFKRWAGVAPGEWRAANSTNGH